MSAPIHSLGRSGAPGGVYLDAQGHAHGTVSDEQIEAVLLGALANVRRRSGLQSPLAPRLAAVAVRVIDEYGEAPVAPSARDALGAALVDEASSLIFERANNLVGLVQKQYEQQLADQRETYEAVARGRLRLIRELDVALNGRAGAAEQASMSDLIDQARARQCVQVLNLADGMRINFRAPTGERATLNLAVLLGEWSKHDGDKVDPVNATMRAAIAAYPVAGEPLPVVPGDCVDEGCPHFGTPHGHDPASVVKPV